MNARRQWGSRTVRDSSLFRFVAHGQFCADRPYVHSRVLPDFDRQVRLRVFIGRTPYERINTDRLRARYHYKLNDGD